MLSREDYIGVLINMMGGRETTFVDPLNGTGKTEGKTASKRKTFDEGGLCQQGGLCKAGSCSEA